MAGVIVATINEPVFALLFVLASALLVATHTYATAVIRYLIAGGMNPFLTQEWEEANGAFVSDRMPTDRPHAAMLAIMQSCCHVYCERQLNKAEVKMQHGVRKPSCGF
jgi:hypothetical protein